MNFRALLTVILIAVFLSACRPRPASLTPTPTSAQLEPGGARQIPLDGGDAPTAVAPRLLLNIVVSDAEGGQQIQTALIRVDGQALPRGCCAAVVVDASTAHTLTVEAPGYQRWEVELAPRQLQHDATLEAPVRLTRIRPET